LSTPEESNLNAMTSELQHWSTSAVDPSQRFAFYSSTLSEALTPMKISSRNVDATNFFAETTSAALGPINVLHQIGAASQVVRRAAEVERSEEHSYHLLVSLNSSWTIVHRGAVKLGPGDAFLTDSNYGFDLDFLMPYDVIHLRLTKEWTRQWLRSPDVLVGRRISSNSVWSRALLSFITQLSPEFVVNAPLPHSVIADQIGALLALITDEMSGAPPAQTKATVALRDRIEARIVARSAEFSLTALNIATDLNISVRTLHRALSAYGCTFGALLLAARMETATRMLQSPLFKLLTTAEIGRRAGFADASHFSRVFKRRTGRGPNEFRNGKEPEKASEAVDAVSDEVEYE
jgi:AraC-like DNA-binding protein